MTKRILVTYASKHGATAEIAEKIGEVIQKAGWATDVLPVKNVADVTSYAAVVVGSAVYMGSWRDEAAKFLENNEQALAERPVWLFSSGPTGEGDPSEIMDGWHFPEALQPVADRIQPRDIVFFHGVLDMKKLNFGEKLLVRGIKAPVGDFRDWDAIAGWAAGIADAMPRE